MGRRHHDVVRSFAEGYYILDRKEITEISAILGVPTPTIRRWRVQDKWDERRLPRTMSGRLVANDLMIQIAQILRQARLESRTVTHEEADGIKKLMSTAEQISPKARFRAHALDTLELLGKFVAERHAGLHDQVVPVLVDFARRLVEQPTL